MPQALPISSRRELIKHGVGLLTVAAASGVKMLTPAQARSETIPFRIFDRTEVEVIDTLGEVLLPGSAASGLAHFIDFQLAGPASDNMLMIKYLGLNPPFADFYRGGIAAVDNSARMKFSRSFSASYGHFRSLLKDSVQRSTIGGRSGETTLTADRLLIGNPFGAGSDRFGRSRSIENSGRRQYRERS